MNWFEIIFILLFLHALGDFALQSDVMSREKNRHNRAPTYMPSGQKPKKTWVYWLIAHAFIQGGLIYVFFPILPIAVFEVVSHFIVDYLKCENITSPHHDQLIHVILRIIYSIILVV